MAILPATEDEVRAALKRAGNINLMGERAVAIAIEMGLVTGPGCIMIGKSAARTDLPAMKRISG